VTSPLTSSHEERAPAPSPAPVTARERLLVVLALAASVGLLLIAGGSILWTRPLWFDEICCTLFVVEGAASPLEVVARVARGEDYAPPLLHVMAWIAGKLAGDLTPVVLRTMALLCVSLALLGLYSALRRRYERLPSLAGVLAVATHSLVLAHAFEGRFYGPWLLFASLFAWSLGIDAGRARSYRRDASMAIASILLVTIHWFGVLSLGLMGVAAMLARRPWRLGVRLVAPGIAGLVALALCVPLVLAHRAGAVEVDALWVPPLSAAQIGVMVRLFFLSTVPVLAIVLLLIDALREPGTRPAAADVGGVQSSLRDPSIAALLSLGLFPVVLIVVSIVLQPSMLDRYAIVTVLAWAPLAALAVSSLDRGGRVVAVLFFATLVVLAARRTMADKRDFAEMVRLNEAAYARALTMDLPVVFASLHTAYPVAGPRRAERRALFVDLPDSTIREMVPQERLGWLRRHIAVERNIARGHARVYGFPVLAPQAQLDTTRAFLLVGPPESFPRLYKEFDKFVGKVFPRHSATRLSPNLAILKR
jgi:hypothetical protein